MFVIWCLLVGVLLIAIGVSDTLRRDLPISTAALYLAAGCLLGPQVLGLLDLGLLHDAQWLERLTEVAVLISLFAVGLRLRAPLRDGIWRTPLVLASATMLVTIAALCGVGLAIGLPPAAALLLAAVLAPTDPVLASDVQVEHARDADELRFSLTGEGGLNDGAAFPFVMLALGLLGLHDLGPMGLRWLGLDVLWAAAGGLGLGGLMGYAFSRAVAYLRRERGQALGMESFFTLGLIALTYGAALAASTYGFLAVFAAGLAMRQVERTDNPGGEVSDRPASTTTAMTRDVLAFTLEFEKLAELTVMLVIGSLLTPASFSFASVFAAAALLFVVRPLAVLATTWGLRLNRTQRRLTGWFGIRGIGSMYYLAYAVAHGVPGELWPPIADVVLVTIVMSVVLHGSSATPLMKLYRRARRGAV